MRKTIFPTALLAFASAIGTAPALAQKFPGKPVTLVVPFAPGGNLDLVARTLAPALGQALGQPVIVDNRAGAGGAIGATQVARAPADGHTLLVSTPNALVVLPLMARTSYRLADFSPVGLVAATPLVMVVRSQGPYRNIEDLLSAIRSQPGRISAGHAGPGTTNHVALLQLEQAGGLGVAAVPYKGSAPALTDLLGGQIDFVVDQLTSSAAHIQSDRLRAVAVLSRERDPALPDVPTLREAGLKDFDAVTATGLLAPAGTPQEVIDTLNTALRKALGDTAVRQRLAAVGSPAQPSSPAQWAARLQREEAAAQQLAATGKLKND